MAGRLLKENRWIEGAVGQGSAQAQAAAAAMLSGGDRDVTVVCVRARPTLSSCEVQTDGVAVQGMVDFTALYLTQEGELGQRGAQAGFTAVLPAGAVRAAAAGGPGDAGRRAPAGAGHPG